ncbi:MAG: type II toxin-antitoxin system Phd/YefM family antitoxin [Proteobacteria bacterium]|nr:type II toxin-antitoxin system Phd/YefM family antitoxin [Pseudomonadota bacterium]
MYKIVQKSAEEARSQLTELLDAAERGQATIITKHGRPVAVLVPLNEFDTKGRQQPLVSLRGSGKGLWGKNSAGTVRRLREEWRR